MEAVKALWAMVWITAVILGGTIAIGYVVQFLFAHPGLALFAAIVIGGGVIAKKHVHFDNVHLPFHVRAH